MACSKSLSKLESLLKCGICREVVKKPQTLGCFHSFCGSCKAQLSTCTVSGESGVRCPLCNAFSGQKFVKPSFLMNELLDMHDKARSGEQKCQYCSEYESKWQCVECRMDLCQKCKLNHLKIPILRSHRIIEKGSDDEMIIDSLVFCSLHSDQQVMFNCKDCEVPLCIKCKVTQHENHKTETIEDTLQRLLPDVKANMKKLQNQITAFDQDHDILCSKITDVRDGFTKCKDEAGNKLNEVIEKLKAEHKELIKQLEVKEEEEVSKLEVARDDIDRKKKEISQVCEWVDTSIEAARGVTLMTEMQAGLYRKVLNLTKSKPAKPVVVHIPKLKVKTQETELTSIKGTVSYDKVSISSKGQRITNAKVGLFLEVFTRQLKCQDNIQLPGLAIRMGMVNDNIWIPVPSKNTIQVFDQEGKLVKSIQHQNGPRSAEQAVNGDIILASDNGLELISEDGEIISCLKAGKFCDASVDGDKFAALNYGTHEISVWQHDDVSGMWKQMSCFRDRHGKSHHEGTLLYFSDRIYAVPYYRNNVVDEYSDNGDFSRQHTPHNPNLLFISDSDDNGDFIVANHNKNELLLFHKEKFESKTLAVQGYPYDVLCTSDGRNVWVLQYNDDGKYYLTKYN